MTWLNCLIALLLLSALCALWFWAAAVLAKLDDVEHGRE